MWIRRFPEVTAGVGGELGLVVEGPAELAGFEIPPSRFPSPGD